MIWREKKIPLIILGILLAANIFFFFTYRVQYQNRLHDEEGRKAAAEQRLAAVARQRTTAEQQIAAYRKARKDLQAVYDDRWSTQPQRLTALINEVKRLASASEMVPPAYSFGRSEKDPTKAGIDTSTVTITFTVHGTYQQVRRLINLLELSNQFVIIDSVALNGAAQENTPLTLNLHLKTIFRNLPNAPPPLVAKEM